MSVEYRQDGAEARTWRGDDAGFGPRARARVVPGALAVVAALLFAVVHGVAVAVGAAGDFATATTLAWVAIVGTTATLVLGVAAFVLRRGRRWAAAAIVVSLLANPFVLTRLLALFGE